MEESKQETIADIVREMRKRAQEVYEGQAGYPESWEDQMNDDEIRETSDRIEAAAKREREAGAEAAQICGEIGEMVGREAACKDSLQVGNAAKMREACENIAEYAKTAACHIEDTHLLSYINQIESWAEAALSSPPRNCDVLSDKQEALAAIHEDRGYVNNPIDERRLTVEWLFDEAKGETHEQK